MYTQYFRTFQHPQQRRCNTCGHALVDRPAGNGTEHGFSGHTNQQRQFIGACCGQRLKQGQIVLQRFSESEARVKHQEAGYAGGDAMWEAFKRWLAERTDIPAESLDVESFEQRATEFFRDAGWKSQLICPL